MQAETKGLFGQIADTFSSKKAKKSNPVAVNATNHQEGQVAKPQSYYTVKEASFKNRKGEEVKDYCLWLEHEPMAIEYKPMPTVPAKTKHIKLDGLKDLASILDLGLTEQISTIIAKDRGYKELVETLADQKVMTLDFLQFIKDEIKKIPAKTSGRQASGIVREKSRKGLPEDVKSLVSILINLGPNLDPAEAQKTLQGLVNDEQKMSQAVGQVVEYLKHNSRDKKGYIKMRNRKSELVIKPKK